MKRLSNEAKVGIIAILTFIVFIWLFNFLKGKNLLNSTATYYTVYNEVGGLAESSPIEVNGYRVGVVQSIRFVDETTGRLLVSFSVKKGFRIPKNTVAEITPVSVLGGMKVRFVFGNGPDFYKNYDTIPGRLAPSITELLQNELVPVKDKITGLVTRIDSVMMSVNEIMDDDFEKNLRGTMSNLNSTTKSIDNVIGAKEKELRAMLENLNKFSKMLADNSGHMSETFQNLENISDTLRAADIYGTIANLKSSLEKTASLIENLNKGEGSAGQILTNKSVYENLDHSLNSLDSLLKDIKAHPKRYVHFSIFGKKDKPSETKPL
jgi:phospholipid/cholesterol/gamma-HCH transport system substrate-binding protein